MMVFEFYVWHEVVPFASQVKLISRCCFLSIISHISGNLLVYCYSLNININRASKFTVQQENTLLRWRHNAQIVQCNNWGANIYGLAVAFTYFESLLWWYGRHLKHMFFCFFRNKQKKWSHQMQIKFTSQKRQSTEGERTWDMFWVAVAFS